MVKLGVKSEASSVFVTKIGSEIVTSTLVHISMYFSFFLILGGCSDRLAPLLEPSYNSKESSRGGELSKPDIDAGEVSSLGQSAHTPGGLRCRIFDCPKSLAQLGLWRLDLGVDAIQIIPEAGENNPLVFSTGAAEARLRADLSDGGGRGNIVSSSRRR